MPLRLVFLGSDSIALPLLEWLNMEARSVAEVIGVFTQPDRAVGRGQQVVANGIKRWALQRALPVFQPEKLTEEVRLQLESLQADMALVMAYGHILRDAFIATPRLGTLNLHASLLPNYRGASPIQTAIACGEKETGVSLMRIVRKLDAGPVADVERVSIDARDTASEVEQKLGLACVPLLQRNLPRLAEGSLVFHPQEDERATYCRRLVKADGVIDFRIPAFQLAARINGLFPWPSCTVAIAGQVIKIGRAAAETEGRGEGEGVDKPAVDASSMELEISARTTPDFLSRTPGLVIGMDTEALRIATGSGVLRLLSLQRPGGRMLSAPEFMRGFPLPPGTILPSETMSRLVDDKPFKWT